MLILKKKEIIVGTNDYSYCMHCCIAKIWKKIYEATSYGKQALFTTVTVMMMDECQLT